MNDILKEYVMNNGNEIKKCVDGIGDLKAQVAVVDIKVENMDRDIGAMKHTLSSHDIKLWKLTLYVTLLSVSSGAIGSQLIEIIK